MSEMHLVILALALLLDRFVGDPDWLWRTYPHPVVWFGRAIEATEKALYPEQGSSAQKKRAGVFLIAGLVIAGWVAAGFASKALSLFGSIGTLVEVAIVAILLAQKSLSDHVDAVRKGLETGGIEGGRKAVAMIVGRDVKALDKTGVSRAAIESLAENTSDGVVGPALSYMAFGLPGLIAYKIINTADSMIGHRSERYLDFGWASARLDDLVNLVPARITGLLACAAFALVDGWQTAERAFATMRRDAKLHKSPNAGWPEAAFAGGLDVALGGPRVYAKGAKGDMSDAPYLHDAGDKKFGVAAITKALLVYDRLLWLLLGATVALAAVF
ncbi:MAG: adenosylcobinamide-phosphate synthase CbiB [Notoacmeibacter sp.]